MPCEVRKTPPWRSKRFAGCLQRVYVFSLFHSKIFTEHPAEGIDFVKSCDMLVCVHKRFMDAASRNRENDADINRRG